MDYKLELVLIPVTDVDRAKHFYTEQMGFDLLVDTGTGLPDMRIVQVTPKGSSCSIGFGSGVTAAEPGSQQGLHLVVADILAAHQELTARGVKVGEVKHISGGEWVPGPDPNRGDYQSFAEIADPDGNVLLLQERGQLGPPPEAWRDREHAGVPQFCGPPDISVMSPPAPRGPLPRDTANAC
jgi:catechol 2,3-dioxygenase-like lactoylglutathione lyase family enzyme